MKTFRSICFLLSLLVLTVAQAQRFGGYPPGHHWRVVENDRVKVIFPPSMQAEAVRIAAVAHRLGRETDTTIGDRYRKVPIVLHGQTLVANAYVGLAPWRSEFYMTPLQNSLDLGSLSWADNLALHEYRHVQQYANFRKGLSRFFYYLAGEEGQVLANAGAVPDWFFEGDAVLQETMYSGQGRGRLPFFFNDYRSIWKEGKRYSFMKLRNGSLRDLVPNHYQLGYPLVAYGRQKYGAGVWREVTDRAVRYKPLFYPFQGAFLKVTGQRYTDFVQEALTHFRVAYEESGAGRPAPLTPVRPHHVANYHMPFVLGGDSILALKSSNLEVPHFVVLHQGHETSLGVRDIADDDYYSYRSGRIVYGAYAVDPRWGWRDHREIVLFDIHTGKRKRLTSRSRYFSPDLSHDGKRIVAVEGGPGGHSAIHILDAGSGERLRVLENPDSLYFTHPRFTKDDDGIVTAARRPDGTMALLLIPLSGGVVRELVHWSARVIAFPRVEGERVFFTADTDGRDAVYVHDLRDGRLYEGVSHLTGSYEAAAWPEGDSVVVSGQDASGRLLFKEALSMRPVGDQRGEKDDRNLYVPELLSQGHTTPLSRGAAAAPSIGRYHEGLRILNFHSWRPMYEQPDWSLYLYGNNVLNTLNSSLHYTYNENEHSHQLGFDETYAGLFPWITAGFSYTFDRNEYLDAIHLSHWDEINAHFGLSVPLNFSKGRHFRYLTLSTTMNAIEVLHQFPKYDLIALPNVHYLESSVRWSMQTQQSLRQINPRFAHSLYLQHRVRFSDRQAWQFLAAGSLYLPGLLMDHSLVLNGAYQARDTLSNYAYTNNFPFSRGYPALNFSRMWKWGVNYNLPLFHPDLGVGNIVYFLRVRTSLFFDWSTGHSFSRQRNYDFRSFGAEVYFDTRWWNQQPLTFGVRYSRLMDTRFFTNPVNANQWELLLPVIAIH